MAGPPAPKESEAKVSSNVTSKQVAQLPANGRNFSSLLRLNPGIVDRASGAENTFAVDGKDVFNSILAQTPLYGRTVVVAEPVYPDEAKAKRIFGEVAVDIKLDREGSVISATAVSGPEELRSAAETAAKLSRFAPMLTGGMVLRISGSIVYNFKDESTTEIKLRNMKAETPTEEDKRAFLLADKLHFSLYRWLVGGQSPNAPFFKDGKVNVVISTLPGLLVGTLKSVGFEPVGRSSETSVTGTISPADLPNLAGISDVKYIAPRF